MKYNLKIARARISTAPARITRRHTGYVDTGPGFMTRPPSLWVSRLNSGLCSVYERKDRAKKVKARLCLIGALSDRGSSGELVEAFRSFHELPCRRCCILNQYPLGHDFRFIDAGVVSIGFGGVQ